MVSTSVPKWSYSGLILPIYSITAYDWSRDVTRNRFYKQGNVKSCYALALAFDSDPSIIHLLLCRHRERSLQNIVVAKGCRSEYGDVVNAEDSECSECGTHRESAERGECGEHRTQNTANMANAENAEHGEHRKCGKHKEAAEHSECGERRER
jgi:uncharacterized low-complexity protein